MEISRVPIYKNIHFFKTILYDRVILLVIIFKRIQYLKKYNNNNTRMDDEVKTTLIQKDSERDIITNNYWLITFSCDVENPNWTDKRRNILLAWKLRIISRRTEKMPQGNKRNIWFTIYIYIYIYIYMYQLLCTGRMWHKVYF